MQTFHNFVANHKTVRYHLHWEKEFFSCAGVRLLWCGSLIKRMSAATLVQSEILACI